MPCWQDRFLDSIDFHSSPKGCWLWTGAINGSGYGHLRVGKKKRPQAHRISYTEFLGEIPEGLLVCHHCDVPLCVNPDHLYAGTRSQNRQDMIKRDRGNYKNNHGPLKPHSKLTWEEVEEIRCCYADGEKRKSLIQRFKVGRSSISNILLNKTWK